MENKPTLIRASTPKEVFAFFWEDYKDRGLFPAALDSDRIAQCDELFVADRDGQIVAAIAMASNGCDGMQMPTLATLYTSKKSRGEGIGSRLCIFCN